MATINNIPQGYKNSPVGIIPQEWEVKRLGEIAKYFSGGTPNSMLKEMYGGKIPFIRSGEIHNSRTTLSLTEEGLSKSSAKMVNVGDLIYALYGANSGDCAISQINGAINQAILCIRSEKVINPYLYPFLELQKGRFISMYLQGGQGNLSADIVARYIIPIPPLAEQKKIAEILCTWDDAIDKQSKLIEKLEFRKRGLMQRLLTGKTRLPGFTEPWKKIKLGEICNITTGRLDANAMVSNGEFPFFTCAKEVYKINNYSFDTEALLVSGNGEYVGYVHYYKGKFNAYQRTYVLDGFICNIFYMYYALKQYLPKRIMRTKSNSNTPYIVKDTLFDMELLLPSDVEQKLIAKLISSADKEIETQRKKLEALRHQKQGLMQQLLTGKTRVKVS